MRPRLIIAGQSGVVIGLLVLVTYQFRQISEAQRLLGSVAPETIELHTNTGQRALRLRLQQLPPINLPVRVEKLDWRSVESEDYATYVANLRSIGCPEQTIRDIILADVNKLYAERRRALAPPPNDWEYWRHSSEETAPSILSDEARDREAAETKLESERRNLLTALLGPAAFKAELDESVTEAMSRRALQFLPDEKRRAIAIAEATYHQAQQELRGITDADERLSKSAATTKAYEDAISAALTPAEREQLAIRSSPLADGLREKLRGFGSSREEFESLFRLEDGFSRQRQQLEAAKASGEDPQAVPKIEAAGIEFDKKLKETLGSTRYADYQRAQDPDFQTLYSLATSHEMAPDVAREVYDMRHTVKQQTDRIRENPLLTADEKTRAFDAIRAETQNAIVDVLGEPLLKEYRRQGGQWLLELTDTQNLGETGVQVVAPPLPEDPTPRVIPMQRSSRFRRVR